MRKFYLCIGTLIILLLVILSSGCIGVQKSNLTVVMPESIETSIGKQEVLNVELFPLEADAKDVVINLSAPSEISFTDQQYIKEFNTLPKDQKVIIPFNYTTVSDGTFNLTIEIKAANANTTNLTFTVNAYVPAPKLEIGEFWIYNQTKGKAFGLRVNEVIRKDVIEGKEYYVVKGTWEGEPTGTYSLTYYSVDTFSQKMTEYYEDDSLLKAKTSEWDPPISLYGFPFKVGKKWSWKGSFTGIGKSETSNEIVKKETITVPTGTHTSYYIRQKETFSIGTGVVEGWYVPELNEFAKVRTSESALGIANEDEFELLEHGKPPAKPRKIQPDIKVPTGYKLYRNDELNFRIAYPADWVFNSKKEFYTSYFYFEDGISTTIVTVEPVGKINLTEYRAAILKNLKLLIPGIKISEEKNVTVNGREGFEWIFEFTSSETRIRYADGWQPYIESTPIKGKQVIFVADGKGYIISERSPVSNYNSYKPIFDNIANSFYIKGSPRYILS